MMGMKKRLFSLIFLFGTISQVAFSQIGDYRSEFAVGINGGYVLSNVGFMPEVPQTMHKGITGGFSLRYTSEKYFSSICAIVAELNYAQVGWKEDIMTPNDEPVINVIRDSPNAMSVTSLIFKCRYLPVWGGDVSGKVSRCSFKPDRRWVSCFRRKRT